VARAAVRAKQAQKAQAQAAAKPSRKQRKHASGGNPNQDLFFMRLRRRQKWVFLGLAIVFAISFSALGVGSGNGGGLEQLYNSILGNGGDPIAKAENEIKTNPAKGYKDLANAYVTKNDLASAIITLQLYLQIKPKDSAVWTLRAGYEREQADTYVTQYQQVVQASQLESPGSIFQPTGTLSTALGTNPIDQYYSQQSSALSTPLYQKAIAGYSASLTDYQKAAKYARGRSARAAAQQAVANAARLTGQTTVELKAWQRYVALEPNSPNLTGIEARCKQLGGSCVPKSQKK
jgi:tetratricopeptide (TPR) repeat protein